MAEQPIEIPIKLGGIQALKKELREIKGAILEATDPEEIARLTARAGELTDRMKDVNEQVAIFAGGSGFEKVSNNIGDLGSKLLSLDFTGAADSARILQKTVASINPQEVTEQMNGLKDTMSSLGKTGGMALNGLIKNVGAIAKAFFSFGVSLLANPIFLLTTAIVAIVGAVVVLMNKLGILKPIMSAIGKVFGWIGDLIDMLVQAFKDFTDWLGITQNAVEDLAEAQNKQLDGMLEKTQAVLGKINRIYGEKIKIAQAEGRNTEELEKDKQKWIIKTAQIEYDAYQQKLKNHKILGDLSEEEMKKLIDNVKSARETLKQAKSDMRILEAEQKAERKKNAEDQAKEASANAKKARDDAKQFAKDRRDAERQARDLELSLLEDGAEKERIINQEKYKRLIEDTKSNEKLLAKEKAEQIKLLEAQRDQEDEKIRNAEKERIAEDQRVIAEMEKQRREQKAIEDQKQIEGSKQRKDKADAEQKAKDDKALEDARINAEARKQIEADLFTGLQALGQIFINDQKKLEKFNKAQALVQIAVDTAKAISSLVATSQANPLNAVTGGLAGIAQYTSGIVQILTNVAKAKAILSSGSTASASGGGGGSSAGGSTQSITPQVNLFGNANQLNNVSAPQSVQAQPSVIKAVVSETEITNTQKNVSKFERLATL